MRIYEMSKGWVCLFSRATLMLIAVLLLPGAVRATNVTVDCDASGSINAALAGLDLVGPHTITVTGTCAENVDIFQRDRVTIQAPPGVTASITAANPNASVFQIIGSRLITLRRLVIRNGSQGIGIFRGSDVHIEGSEIEDNSEAGVLATENSIVTFGGASPEQFVRVSSNGGPGIAVNTSVLNIFGFTTIEDNGAAGIVISFVGQAIIDGIQGENVIRRNGSHGVLLNGTSDALFSGQNTIRDNEGAGVQVVNGSHAAFNAFVLGDGTERVNVIERNGRFGVNVAGSSGANFNGPNTIRINDRGGVRIANTSHVGFFRGNVITNNIGPGVRLERLGDLTFNGNTIMNNTEEGVQILRQSVASFNRENTIAGNGVANISCDTTSLMLTFSDLTAITNIKCQRIARVEGPPRRGVIKGPVPEETRRP